MKFNMRNQKNLKEEMLNDVTPVVNAPEVDEKPPEQRPQGALDDTRRVKVLSPGMLVFKRFIRNKLAIVGTITLLFMFAFCFIGGWGSKYEETEVFHKYDTILFDYGSGSERSSLVNYYIENENLVPAGIRFSMDSIVADMKDKSENARVVTLNDSSYTITKQDDKTFTVSTNLRTDIADVSTLQNAAVCTSFPKATISSGYTVPSGTDEEFIAAVESEVTAAIANAVTDTTFVYNGYNYKLVKANKFYVITQILDTPVVTYEGEPLGGVFEAALNSNLNNGSFVYGGVTYTVTPGSNGTYSVVAIGDPVVAFVSSLYVFDYYDETFSTSMSTTEKDAFEKQLIYHLFDGSDFVIGDVTYRVSTVDDNLVISTVSGGETTAFANVSTFVARRYNGEDSMSIEFKKQFQTKIEEMLANNESEGTFTFYMALIDEEGNPVLDDEGDPVFDEAEFEILRKTSNFTLRNLQSKYLIDIYAEPSNIHVLGTDANGMDVLTRIMFGGRISLMIGFIVIFIEIFIGIILGGIAGYFGKWVDNIIMRLVDIFNCIPAMPILIITGALFDKLQMDSYTRIMYLMIILGILGWPGIARLVRGQILYLREQEFMIAAEATGLKAGRKIFRHLIPNVMPQLIVNATMGLGGIILTESTLSFLGLGAKYPLATWGAMINSVSSPDAMTNYVYIWLPVGLLICLTVIAFNFVGDGLRDAYDPKMKR